MYGVLMRPAREICGLGSPSGHESYDNDGQSNDQQKVDEPSGYVEGKPKQPQNQKNDGDSPKHNLLRSPLGSFPDPQRLKNQSRGFLPPKNGRANLSGARLLTPA
jgi:hypothetical protein